MADREKVIKGLECCGDGYYGDIVLKCHECLYGNGPASDCRYNLHQDALALLKEQEAVAPEKEHSGSCITWWNVCGNCKTAINPNDKYCHECGKAVKWNE